MAAYRLYGVIMYTLLLSLLLLCASTITMACDTPHSQKEWMSLFIAQVQKETILPDPEIDQQVSRPRVHQANLSQYLTEETFNNAYARHIAKLEEQNRKRILEIQNLYYKRLAPWYNSQLKQSLRYIVGLTRKIERIEHAAEKDKLHLPYYEKELVRLRHAQKKSIVAHAQKIIPRPLAIPSRRPQPRGSDGSERRRTTYFYNARNAMLQEWRNQLRPYQEPLAHFVSANQKMIAFQYDILARFKGQSIGDKERKAARRNNLENVD